MVLPCCCRCQRFAIYTCIATRRCGSRLTVDLFALFSFLFSFFVFALMDLSVGRSVCPAGRSIDRSIVVVAFCFILRSVLVFGEVLPLPPPSPPLAVYVFLFSRGGGGRGLFFAGRSYLQHARGRWTIAVFPPLVLLLLGCARYRLRL